MKKIDSLFALVVLLGACGGTTTNGGTTSDASRTVTSADAFLEDFCAAFAPCCAGIGKTANTSRCAAT